jgi:hypothetical protein
MACGWPTAEVPVNHAGHLITELFSLLSPVIARQVRTNIGRFTRLLGAESKLAHG